MIKSSADHIITPSMRMTFNPSSLRSVTSDGCSGSYDVRSRVYTDSMTLQKSIQTKPSQESTASFVWFIRYFVRWLDPPDTGLQGQLSFRNNPEEDGKHTLRECG